MLTSGSTLFSQHLKQWKTTVAIPKFSVESLRQAIWPHHSTSAFRASNTECPGNLMGVSDPGAEYTIYARSILQLTVVVCYSIDLAGIPNTKNSLHQGNCIHRLEAMLAKAFDINTEATKITLQHADIITAQGAINPRFTNTFILLNRQLSQLIRAYKPAQTGQE